MNPRKVREMTIVGTRGTAVYDDLEPIEKIRIYRSGVGDVHPHPRGPTLGAPINGHGSTLPVILEEPLHVECRHFIECIRTGAPPISDGKNGWEMVRILEAADESLKSQRVVRLSA